MSDAFLASFLIGLREGLEATLVVTVLVAFLVKSDRRSHLKLVWAGVAGAVVLSVAFGYLLTYTRTRLLADPADRELFEAITSVAAVAFVTWMVFWMRRAARTIAGDLRTKLSDAIALGPLAVVAMAFLAVVREGLETALIFFSAVQGVQRTTEPLIAISVGVLAAALLGFLLYRSVLRINLTRFFTWTGVLLILIAAGIFKYGVHDFQEAGVLPPPVPLFDISSVLDPNSWYGALLAGMFNITPAPTALELIAWLAYAVPVLILFLWRRRRRPVAASPDVAEPAQAAA